MLLSMIVIHDSSIDSGWQFFIIWVHSPIFNKLSSHIHVYRERISKILEEYKNLCWPIRRIR